MVVKHGWSVVSVIIFVYKSVLEFFLSCYVTFDILLQPVTLETVFNYITLGEIMLSDDYLMIFF